MKFPHHSDYVQREKLIYCFDNGINKYFRDLLLDQTKHWKYYLLTSHENLWNNGCPLPTF